MAARNTPPQAAAKQRRGAGCIIPMSIPPFCLSDFNISERPTKKQAPGQKKNSRPKKAAVFSCHIPLHSAGDLTGTEASGADVHVSGGALHDRLHALHVGLPGAVGTAMRVGHLNAEGDALVAEFAFGHVAYLLAMRIAYQKASTGIIPAFAAECKSFLKINKKVFEWGAHRVGS